ncbi:MAG: ornithine carbamoyltransferase [Candidatus Desulfofervidaceae bacterium]|nr:ornithine carbamoyltransferase [Candidatus Desulfofervidaceae bacterium]
MKKNILTILDLTTEEILALLERAIILKKEWKEGKKEMPLTGKTLALIFEKPSTRTRVSFEVAMYQLGGQVVFLTKDVTQIARQEPPKDTARVLSRYVDVMAMRTYSQELIEETAHWASIPVINALSNKFHPCQILSDLMTVKECKGQIEGLKIAWVGDGNNVAHSWINAAIRLNFTLHLACPPGYEPDSDVLEKTKGKSNIVLTTDPIEAVKGADVINTDVWVSMGDEGKQKEKEVFLPYQLNLELLRHAKPDAIVMHCLPAHRGEEITEEVIEGPQSVVFQQAENKLHLHKALLEWVLLLS